MSNEQKVSSTKVKDFEENNKSTMTYRAVTEKAEINIICCPKGCEIYETLEGIYFNTIQVFEQKQKKNRHQTLLNVVLLCKR